MTIDIHKKANNHETSLKFRKAKLESSKKYYMKILKNNFRLESATQTLNERMKRFEKIRYLKSIGIKSRNDNCSLYTNYLSPGCVYCTKAIGITISPTSRCNSSCFYCYQLRPSKSIQSDMKFSMIARMIKNNHNLLKSFAITGGEPLLALDTVYKSLDLVKYITSSNCQTRLYTNGDLLNKNILKRLKESGLKEIRIGGTYENINLRAIKLSKVYIPRVMAEIPILPNSEDMMKRLLLKLDRLKIFGVNIKELNFSGHNHEEFKKRGYKLKKSKLNHYFESFIYQPLYPIYKSEETCFNLLEFAAKKKLKINVHYCSIANKRYYTHLIARKRSALNNKKGYETITKNGLFKTLIVCDPFHIKIYEKLKDKLSDKEINLDLKNKYIKIHPRNEKFLNKEECEMGFLYSLPNGKELEIKLSDEIPRKAYLVLGYSCNNNCIHCFNLDMILSLKNQDKIIDSNTEELKEIISKMSNEGIKEVVFTGGEPTIRKDFFDILKFAKDLGLKVTLETNARMFCVKDFTRKTFKINPDLSLIIPLHHTNSKIHDKITRTKGSYEQTIQGIKNIIKNKIQNITLNVILLKQNYRDLENIVKYVNELGIKKVNFIYVDGSGNGRINWFNVAPHYTEIKPYLKKTLKIVNKLRINAGVYNIPFCFVQGYERYVSGINNHVKYHLGNESIEDFSLGIREDIIKECFIDRERKKPEQCRKCRYFNICSGVWEEYLEFYGTEEFKPIKLKKN